MSFTHITGDLWGKHPAARKTASATGWRPPKEFPNLSGAKILGLDVESKDLELTKRGPGAVRGAAHVVGVSLATEERAWYFPIRHEYAEESGLNMDPAKLFAWLKDVLARPIPKVGANLLYDLECLRPEGVEVAGSLLDVQFAEPLLDEEAGSYALEQLATTHLGEGKTSSALYEWCARTYGGKPTPKQRANIWRAPPSMVGPYAESDARLPLAIMERQKKLLQEQELMPLFELECGLIPLLLDMRFRGVRVDIEAAERVAHWLRKEATKAQRKLKDVDVWASASLAKAFDAAGVEYPRTEKGAPSFTKLWLEAQHTPLAKAVLAVRTYEKAANPFVESYILGMHHLGRLHCQFNPLRSDDYGTVTGRFSSSNPNLQNIPSRDDVIGPLLRSLFIPEDGCLWRRADYSQVEFRLLAHYAIDNPLFPGRAESVRERYRKDPKTDFHEMTQQLVHELTSVELGRKPAKNLNFGLVYGMGKEKTTRSLGVSPDLGERLNDAYHAAMPMVKATARGAERKANRRGYVKTILRRRRRFKNGEGTFRALNAVLQGSSADIIKKAMYECYRRGLFAADACGIPHLTVHDELDWSDAGTKKSAEAFAEVEHVMTTCVPLKVPLLVDVSTGKSWGECK